MMTSSASAANGLIGSQVMEASPISFGLLLLCSGFPLMANAVPPWWRHGRFTSYFTTSMSLTAVLRGRRQCCCCWFFTISSSFSYSTVATKRGGHQVVFNLLREVLIPRRRLLLLRLLLLLASIVIVVDRSTGHPRSHCCWRPEAIQSTTAVFTVAIGGILVRVFFLRIWSRASDSAV